MNLRLLKKIALLGGGAALLLLGTACEPKKTRQIAFVYDQSKSKIDGCDCLTGILEKTLKEGTNGGAKITLFKLGEPGTGFEPKVVEVYDVPKAGGVLEGKNKRVEKEKAIITDFQAKCRGIGRTNDTPLIQAMSKIIEFLKQNGCDEKLGCQVIVQSDLQESVQKTANPKLPERKAGNQVSNQNTQFANSGISVAFYGVSEVEENASKTPGEVTKIVSNAKSRSELKDVWKQKFTDPGLVKFFDFCTVGTSSEATAQK